PNKKITAAYINIGDEILSGRTKDKNINFIAKNLTKLGIHLKEVRIIPDDKKIIVNTVNELRKKFTYIFTTGGIGPTHDDVTTEAIAQAFNKKIIRNKEAERLIRENFDDTNPEVNEPKLKMADIPKDSTLIYNPVSFAPGYMIENVIVMAGVPKIMQEMFKNVKKILSKGEKIIHKEISLELPESILAKKMDEIQKKYYNISVGSYPFSKKQKDKIIFYGTSVVLSGVNKKIIEDAYIEILKFAKTKINGKERRYK
ncbi:competence/damage-inducible protein A, partial [Pseudomonadota bacterium]